MTTSIADYRISLTYQEAVDTARLLAQEYPDFKTPYDYNVCLVGKILEARGFKAPPDWWDAQRTMTYGFAFPKELSDELVHPGQPLGHKRATTHIQFLIPEIFLNQDLIRDAFLRRLQDAQDRYQDNTWKTAFRKALAYSENLNKEYIANRVVAA